MIVSGSLLPWLKDTETYQKAREEYSDRNRYQSNGRWRPNESKGNMSDSSRGSR